MTIVFSILRNIALAFLLWFSQVLPPPAGAINPLAPLPAFDVFVVDQQSVCVPFLRLLTGTPVVFYCHFPDKLLSGGWQITFGDEVNLSRNAGGLLKKAYRWPIDTLEEWTTGEFLWTYRKLTTGQADVILANSKFTSRVYSAAFSSLRKRQPSVVYPCIDVDAYQGSSVRKGKAKAEDGVDLVVS